ncbi:MAG: NAD(P)-binding domain-containing protein, partial [Thermodesulfovibrionales bacterium]|nr:NAD(P)-binding domain-containing protein [Thermodesulfovibrionales bacterium]
MSYVTVIGAGSWGTTLACLLSEKGFDVTLWVFEKDLADEIEQTRCNSTYLPGVTIPDSLKISNDIKQAVQKARYVLNAVPSQFTRAVFSKAAPHLMDEAIIISVSKGIERGTLL